MNPPNSSAVPAAGVPAVTPAATQASRNGAAVAVFWLVGGLALAAAVTLWLRLPTIREQQAFALLDQIPIQLNRNKVRGEKGPVDETATNPVTGKKTPFFTYSAYVGLNQPERSDLEARQRFIALADLCGQNPDLAMRVFRAGLDSPLDKTGFPRRLVANEMLIFLRDVGDLHPDKSELRITQEDLFKVAQIAQDSSMMEGAGRRAADILALLLAFPADFPDRLTVVDFDARGKAAIGRLVYLTPRVYGDKAFKEPFFEQGIDCLLLFNLVKMQKQEFVWDPQLRRFMYNGPKPPAVEAAPMGGPAAPANNPLEKLTLPGVEPALPTPPTPPPTPGP